MTSSEPVPRKSSLRKTQEPSATDSPSPATSPGSEYASMEQLKEWKTEAEDRMNYLNKEIERVSHRLADVEEAFSPTAGSMSASRNRGGRHDTLCSTSSKVKFKMPDDEDEQEGGTGDTFPASIAAMSGQRRDNQRGSTGLTSSMGMSSVLSEVYDPAESRGSASLSSDHEHLQVVGSMHPQLSAERAGELQRLLSDGQNKTGRKRGTAFEQGAIASKLSLTIRLFGLALAFVTMVFLWEMADLFMILMFPNKEIVLIGYLVLAVTSAGLLAFSHEWLMSASESQTSSLVASFAYALSTLYMAIGTWGTIRAIVMVLVPLKKQIFWYSAAGLISLIGTVMYGIQTRHNVLLDMASCATTMGLHDEAAYDIDHHSFILP